MKKRQDKSKTDGGISLLLSIIVVFCILGAVVFSVARKISTEMSASEIQNLSESLDLIECTIEAVLNTGAWCSSQKEWVSAVPGISTWKTFSVQMT